MSKREGEVLQLACRGMTARQISTELHISISTTHCHIGAIIRKCQAVNLVQAVSNAYRSGILNTTDCYLEPSGGIVSSSISDGCSQ